MLPRAIFLLVAALSAACWVEPDNSPPPSPRIPAPAATATGSADPALPPTSLLVKVDTGRTLNAEPGQGVGIFVEYSAAGQWHVWWTCDTVKTNASCEFDLRIGSESGDLQSIHSEGVLAGDSVTSTDARTIVARSTTGSNAVGVRFGGPVGGIISIDAAVGGIRDAGYYFFVQDAQPNGGYTGPLTNPLRFQGSTP